MSNVTPFNIPTFSTQPSLWQLDRTAMFGAVDPMELAARIARQKSSWAEASFVTRNRDRLKISDGIGDEIERARRLLEGIGFYDRAMVGRSASTPSGASESQAAQAPEEPSPDQAAGSAEQERVDSLRAFSEAVDAAAEDGLVDLATLEAPDELRDQLDALEPAESEGGLFGLVDQVFGLLSVSDVQEIVGAALTDAEADLADALAAAPGETAPSEPEGEGGTEEPAEAADAAGGEGASRSVAVTREQAIENPYLQSVIEAMERGLARIDSATDDQRRAFVIDRVGTGFDGGPLAGGYSYDLASAYLLSLSGLTVDWQA